MGCTPRPEERQQHNKAEHKKYRNPLTPLIGGDAVDLLQATPPEVGSMRYCNAKVWSAIILATCILVFGFGDAFASRSGFAVRSAPRPVRSVRHSIRASSVAVLEVFQIYPPVLTATPNGILEITDGSSNASIATLPSSKATCQEILMVHTFASSYKKPFVGQYKPPACSFNRVTWNLTVTSAGKQFDRLGTVSFGDIELFRTSTAEPRKNGIAWTYLKDMTTFLSLFKRPQTIIFDLGNIIDDTYTAPFNVTLSAAFFTADDSIVPADLIVPVSNRTGASGQPSYFATPTDAASNSLRLPRNIKKAVFTVAATGQADEEFWWSNVPQSTIDTFPNNTLLGYSPFREVQVSIDGMLAGVAWPFPIIFTGGVVPGLWRPIVGIDAFDLREDEIDITPWLPILCDGEEHTFAISVSGLNDTDGVAVLSNTTNDSWYVSGKIFVWLDTPGHITTGRGPFRNVPDPAFDVSYKLRAFPNGTANATLSYHVSARRALSFSSTIYLSDGQNRATWSQDLSYSNIGKYGSRGNKTTNTQRTTGYDVSSSGYIRRFDYPLYADQKVGSIRDNLTIEATVHRAKVEHISGTSVFPTGLESFSNAERVRSLYDQFQGASLITTQNGTGYYTSNQTIKPKTSYSVGTTEQDMSFSGVRASQTLELFHRYAKAVNGSVVHDEETLVGVEVEHGHGVPGNGLGMVLSGNPGQEGRIAVGRLIL